MQKLQQNIQKVCSFFVFFKKEMDKKIIFKKLHFKISETQKF